jgi:5-phospho-D-xylono-1,4-lactonase
VTSIRHLVRTVLGDVPSADLGFTYAHEHLVLDSALIAAGFPHILLDDTEIAIREVAECREAGVRTMVDAMPCAAGRDAVRLVEISLATGVHVLAVTGLHHGRYYGPRHWSSRIGADELGDLFADDILIGIDVFDYSGPVVRRTDHRAGLVKIATGGDVLGDRDRLLIEAAAIAHARTGAPILTHCEHGHGALQQLEALVRHGVPPDAVLLSHIDKVSDVGYHRALAQSGAWLLFDQAIRHHELAVTPTAGLVARLWGEGYGDQILLATDGARRSLWHSYDGAPGLAWLAMSMPAQLRGLGLSADEVDAVFVRNPSRALSLHGDATG